MRKFIKLIIFFSIIIGFYSCVFDPAPRGLYIKLKSENIDEIESVFVSGDTLFADQNLINEYNSDKFYYEHYVPLYNSFFKVKVVFKDSTVLYSETIHYEFQKYAYYISITKKGIVFEKNYKNLCNQKVLVRLQRGRYLINPIILGITSTKVYKHFQDTIAQAV